ncbi:hypothetical protein Aperf_G00000089981 [Anoplocephala perfoliata]
MYISVSDFSWLESNDEFYVSVPLRGTPAQDCEIFLTTKYVKITFKPYFFECVFFKEIDVVSSNVIFESCVAAHLTLKKKISAKWNRLDGDEMKDKEAFLKIREEAIAEIQAHHVEKNKKNCEEKRLGEKASLQAMMKIEGEDRSRFEQIKKDATSSAIQELVALQNEKKKQSADTSADTESAHTFGREYSRNSDIFYKDTTSEKKNMFENEKKIHIPVRSSDKIVISFTPRVFPTPERESTKEDEEKWLQKQAERRRILVSKVAEGDDLSEVERDPIWLQKKSLSLFRAGDPEAAAFALSEALKLAPKLPSLYLNRSACYIQMRNFFRALEDASAALDLLKPPVPQNLNSRVKAHVRRGVAFCNLQMLKEGICEYEAAAKLDPHDPSIKEDLSRLKAHISIAKEKNITI